jgi:SAM-dependent methyltransferase
MKATKSNVILDGKKIFHPCYCGNQEFLIKKNLEFGVCSVIECTKCGQLRTYPEPSPEALSVEYSQANEKYSTGYISDDDRSQLWGKLNNGILDDIAPFSNNQGRLLDIGCQFGELLFLARRLGYEADGLEINQGNVEYVRKQGFKVYSTILEEAEIPDNHYDAIVVNHVLEHVPNPKTFLDEVRRILRPGGLLFIGVPCFESIIPIHLKRGNWYALLPEEHIWQFGQESLITLLKDTDFNPCWINRGCDSYWGDFSLSPKDIIRWTLYKSIAKLGKGDFINVISRNEKSL